MPTKKPTGGGEDRIVAILKLVKAMQRVRATDVYKALDPKTDSERDALKGLLRRLAERGELIDLNEPDANGGKPITWYYLNDPEAYDPKELANLIPTSEIDRIGDAVEDQKRPRQLAVITRQLYGVRHRQPMGFVAIVLQRFIDEGLVAIDKKTKGYYRTERGVEMGLDSQTLITIKATELENQIVAREEQAIPTIKTLAQFGEMHKHDLRGKTLQAIAAPKPVARKDATKMLFISEPLIGNQFTDAELLEWIIGRDDVSPDLTFVSGLVAGSFTGNLIDKRRTLMDEGGMAKLGHQFHVAGILLGDLQKKTRHGVYVVQGDDDWEIAKDNAHLAQIAEGDTWGLGINRDSLTAEQRRRMAIRSFYAKWRIQWERIVAYQLRIGRGLYNANEVYDLIGVRKREYRLIIEILVAQKHKLQYPKEYEQIVNIPALMGDVGIRHVSPDTLMLDIGNGREVRFVHNFHFSSVTQYVDPLLSPEMAMRQCGARGGKPPFMLAGAHQEFFYAHYLPGKPEGSWIMTLPGMKSALEPAEFRMREFSGRVISGKEHRQGTFRRSPAIPAGLEVVTFKDGRVQFRLLNDAMKRVLDAQKGKPGVEKILAVVTDTQVGSITMQPEAAMRWMDYAFYHCGATHLWEDGDMIHGRNYRRMPDENQGDGLIAIEAQQEFVVRTQVPLILGAPRLEQLRAVEGNHEYDSMGHQDTGVNHLMFLQRAINGYCDGMRAAGKKPPAFQEAIVSNRVRFVGMGNPGEGDIVYHPYFAEEIAGFKVAMMHMWQPGGKKGGGGGGMRTPVDEMRMWMRNMGLACADIDLMIGGHHHSVWMCQEAGKLLVKVGAAAGQSGYELARGLTPTTMFTLFRISNRHGITVEFVPWWYLLNAYQCESPFLKGHDGDLALPKPGTREYRFGKRSPFVEDLLVQARGEYRPV